MRGKRSTSASVVVGISLAASGAWAAPTAEEAALIVPSPSVYAGLFLGANLPAGGWDLAEVPDEGQQPFASALLGVRVGVQAVPWLGAEIGASFIPFSAADGRSGTAIGLFGDALISPFEVPWAPYLAVGAGYYLGSGDLGSDQDGAFRWGIGVRGMMNDWLALRVDARHNLTDGDEGDYASVLECTVGVDFLLWRGAESDVDGDGVADKDDTCPEVAGVASLAGCPDKDGDGITDAEDACPEVKGVKALKGCPDADGDGITDADDKCPAEPGDAAHEGCAPPPPDTDGDGVIDAKDACPEVKGPAELEGCPDQDGDGIADKDDRCPDQAGVASEQGCLPADVQKKFTGSIKGIQFATGSAAIKKSSFKLLDEAVAALNAYPTLRLEVSGHTDDRGTAEANTTLSQARADAVRQYLVEKGIDAGRLVAIGYGPTRPIADNKTGPGRAENRRIEFRMMGR